MPLVLKVLSYKGQPLCHTKTVSFNRHGGTIGRSETCTLQLADPEKFVSRLHAVIKYEFGNYYLTDCSLSGVLVNKQKLPLHNQSHQLFDGMLLWIGEYGLSVCLDNQHTQPAASEAGAVPLISPDQTAVTDPGNLGKSTLTAERPVPVNYCYPDLPDDMDPESDNLLEAFLEGAELSHTDIEEGKPLKIMYQIGQMFRALARGSVAILRSRAEFKNFFHVNLTVLQGHTPNPLKAVISTDEVLRQLLKVNENGDLASVEAIEQGFSDVVDHQLAVQAGVQAALKELLQQFDPENIERQFDNSLVLQKKAKCWQAYKDSYTEISNASLNNFYGEAFVEAYERQMKVLLSLRSKR